ncbi:hypothetical protein [Wenjunlia tyrosinilytica]|uniref:Uncharacterized protein n=1 Tax=Wenjunlia tyrosinilytica TaxID=1544741 RepID=A0A917ZRQ3_9ACTN|nr:hypothetical protein [Wenjunlia tyrosinilytica]GGO88703.1 hypothetical protein GCM10012280_30120 [Wenjunlia tyrosinilytica]
MLNTNGEYIPQFTSGFGRKSRLSAAPWLVAASVSFPEIPPDPSAEKDQ